MRLADLAEIRRLIGLVPKSLLRLFRKAQPILIIMRSQADCDTLNSRHLSYNPSGEIVKNRTIAGLAPRSYCSHV